MSLFEFRLDASLPRILIVTPMHNEQSNVRSVHAALARQTFKSFDWIVVDDGSTDGTATAVGALQEFPVPRLVVRANDGGLVSGSAYTAWQFGIDAASVSDYDFVMKLDADVILPPEYFARTLELFTPEVGLAGGVLVGRGRREQVHHVPGPIKLYRMSAFNELEQLPRAIGFDVMDEVVLAGAGYRTVVGHKIAVSLRRDIGASEGGLHGRWRNGRVSRWTGYDPAYFLLHVLRYLARKPYVLGAVAMVVGYARAGEGPYNATLKRAHRQQQRAKLRQLVKHPIRWLRETYLY